MKHTNKVVEITLLFWIMKILATTLGETLGDMLSMTFNLGYLTSLLLTMAVFLVVLFSQLAVKRLYPVLFWLVVIGTTTVGTEISDFMDRTLGLGYMYGSLILSAGLFATLGLWYYKEKTLIVSPIYSFRVELFYWIPVLFSNSLGTAFGDYLSDDAGLSYGTGALVTAGIIGLVVLIHYTSRINHIVLFWIAFIFTRPFGATFGDLLTKPLEKGGLNLGTIPATIVTSLLLFSLMLYAGWKHSKNRITSLD